MKDLTLDGLRQFHVTPEVDVAKQSRYLTSLSSRLGAEKPTKREAAGPGSEDETIENLVLRLKISTDQVAKVTPGRIFSMAIHPSVDNVVVGVGDINGHVGLWNVAAKNDGVEILRPHVAPVNSLSFDTFNSNKLISTSYDGTVRSFDLQHQAFSLVYGIPELKEAYTGFHCQVDEHQFLVAFNESKSVGLVDIRKSNVSTSHLWKVFDNGDPKTVSVHPVDTHLMLVPSNAGECKIFDIRSRVQIPAPVSSLVDHTQGIISAFFSPLTGKNVVTVSYDDTIKIFDVEKISTQISASRVIKHNNKAGQNQTPFRAQWLSSRDDAFIVASQEHQIEAFDAKSGQCHGICGEQLKSRCAVVGSHPTKNIVIGGNSSGKVFVFAE